MDEYLFNLKGNIVLLGIQNIKKKRVIKYFIDAAARIAKEEGISRITIRKVAAEAGYNSATLYNYFNSIEDLLDFAIINSITDYLNEIYKILISDKHEVLKYFESWKCYCKYSFTYPSIYTYAFASRFSENVLNKMNTYFEMFPEAFSNINISQKALKLILTSGLNERDSAFIRPCIECGYFNEKDAIDINIMAYMLHGGLMYSLENSRYPISIQESIQQFSKYYIEYMNWKRTEGYPPIEKL